MFGRGGSVQLARIFGIRIGASPSWFVFLFLLIWGLAGFFDGVLPDASALASYATAVAGALLFFASIALHELGHAVVARRNGIDVQGIDLWVFGGLAKLSRDSETPGEEFRIAIAGPIVTFIIGLLCLGGVALFSHESQTFDLLAGDTTTTPLLALVAWLAMVNAVLLAFNLLPGFPLDGGRIARAVVWRVTGDRGRATRVAGRFGQGLSYLLMGVGLYALLQGDGVGGLWMLVLGWFLSQGARGAIVAGAFSERIDGVTVADLMEHDPVAIPAGTTALTAQDEFFLRYRQPWMPVTDPAGHLLGLLMAERVDGAVTGGQPALEAVDLLEEGADVRVGRDTPLETLLASEPLRRLGALAVVDGEGRLCGLITVERIRKALAASL
jgi:Zn-dependent protease